MNNLYYIMFGEYLGLPIQSTSALVYIRKKPAGERYHNGRRFGRTTYWTYAAIHRMLNNQMYIGNIEQGRNVRTAMRGNTRQLDRPWVRNFIAFGCLKELDRPTIAEVLAGIKIFGNGRVEIIYLVSEALRRNLDT